jgi:glutamine synthetase
VSTILEQIPLFPAIKVPLYAPQKEETTTIMPPPVEAYPDLHHINDLDHATESDLRQLIRTFPVIDNHAHNLLTEENAYGSADYPFECITSEASGHALADHVHSTLPHMRGIKQLAEFFQCPPTLQDVKAARYEWVRRDYPGLIKRCFEGTHAIMMDDGLQPQIIHPFKWHRQFVPTVSRIVRVEAVAAELLEHLAIAAGFLKVGLDADWDISQTEAFLVRFNTVLRNQIRTLANDPDVRGFKSVICYRTGLDVSLDSRNNFRPHQSLTGSNLLNSFHDFMQNAVRHNNYRIEKKEVNDYLVVAVCDVLEKLVDTDGENLPFQFHTGLGDTDINLVKSNPAYMQPLIEAFPNVDFVILHSSYPFTREAGYLAANYVNAWLDIGEVYPMLSRDGEESVLRQALELTPSSKILWSTDGHFYPETYYLANRQFRSTLEKVLVSYVQAGDITTAQAVDVATDILFWNSNTLYRLDEERKYPELLRACGRIVTGSLRTMTNGTSTKPASYKSSASTAVDTASQVNGRPGPSSRPTALRPAASNNSLPLTRTSGDRSPIPDIQIGASPEQKVATFEAFLQTNPGVKYIWMHIIDYTSTVRNRMMTTAAFRKLLSSGKALYTTTAVTRIMQDDHPASGFSATGQFLLEPDLTSLCLNKGISSPSATVQTWWMQDTPSMQPTDPWDRCPRNLLQRQVDLFESEYNVTILMGFELEIVFMRPILDETKTDYAHFEPLDMVHSWSNLTYQSIEALPMVEEIVDALASIDIHLPHFHPENAPGQWEFPLPHATPVKAVDTLYKARSVIQNIAKSHGLKATVYPRPYNFTCGSACHAHISLNLPQSNPDLLNKYSSSFVAGLLEHLPSVLAFTLPLEESYARVTPGVWSGGEYVCWGTQNKEVPLRFVSPGHWELKTLDGMANTYIAVSAVLAAGLHGLRKEMPLTMQDCTGDPTGIGEEKRQELGIKKKLPHTLEESLWCLKRDKVLEGLLGEGLIADYVAVKESEMAKLRGFGDEKRRVWLISRY